jgi:hypothetical protein
MESQAKLATLGAAKNKKKTGCCPLITFDIV